MWKCFIKAMEAEQNPYSHQNIHNIREAVLYAADHIETIREILPKYTIHGVQHSCNVMDIMGKILIDMGIIDNRSFETPYNGISSYEIALLILAAFFHDIGMCISETTPLREEVWFEGYIRSKINRSSSDIEKEYIRDCHHIRSKLFIDHFSQSHTDFCWSENNGNLKYFSELEVLCQSHNEGKAFLNNMDSIYGQDVKFCALILRLADILDLDNTRAPYSELKKIEFEETSKDIYSWYEWKKHWDSSGIVFDDNNVLRLIGSTPDPIVYQKLDTMVMWIKHELDQCREVLITTTNRFREAHFPQMIVNDIKPVKFVAAPLSYEIDQSDAIRLFMGENLYLDKMVFVRELLQNAIDASVYFQKLSRKDLLDKHFIPDDFQLPPPTINIRIWRNESGKVSFFIEDDGIGMNEKMISNYFLKIGKSFYRSEEVTQDGIDFTPISRFGVGFLSAFLVTDEITVVTRHYKNENILLQLTVNLKQNSYVLRKNEISRNRYDIQEEIVDWSGSKNNWNKIFKNKKNGTCIYFEIDDSELDIDASTFEKAIYKYFLPSTVNVKCNLFGKEVVFDHLPGSLIGGFEHDLSLQEICSALRRSRNLFSQDDKAVFVSLPLSLNYKNNNDLIQGEVTLLSIYDTSTRPNTYNFTYRSDYKSNSIGVDIGGYLENISDISFSPLYEYYRRNNGIDIFFNGINHLYSAQENDSIRPEYWSGYIMLEGRYRPIVDIARSGKGSLDIETLVNLYYLIYEQLSKFACDAQGKRQMVSILNLPSVLKASLSSKEISLMNEVVSQKKFNWEDVIYIKTSLGALTINEIRNKLNEEPDTEIILIEKTKVKDKYTVLECIKRKLITESFGMIFFFSDGSPKTRLTLASGAELALSKFPEMFFADYKDMELLKYNNYPINRNHWFAKWCIENMQIEEIKQIIQLLKKDFFIPNTKYDVVNEINGILSEHTDSRLSINDFVLGEKDTEGIWDWIHEE